MQQMNKKQCKEFLCGKLDQPIRNKKEYRKWALRHHPDKGGDAEEFKKNSIITGCLEQLDVPEVDCS